MDVKTFIELFLILLAVFIYVMWVRSILKRNGNLIYENVELLIKLEKELEKKKKLETELMAVEEDI